ncbi:hypothetical protein J437_LFUL003554 [Ladona fulva]|uniref:Ribosomal RNA-processing protein 14/surfeit locus protein 6 C-terminal domain-containing protein n=1 Tax=Ladona fulva TaxID=123851 RepID=A0A8K0JV52_LADFU|nr:hypothetical protein J437_LFUL003554 [Ladona fulva]
MNGIEAKLNYKEVESRLKEEDQFISQLFKSLPNIRHGASEEGEDEVSPYLLNNKKGPKSVPEAKNGSVRAKSLEELHARLKELHGKKLDYKEKLLKKKLKNQMKKKKRSKELNMKRTLVKLPKTERDGIVEGTNGITSHRLAKPVFNSAGKMVFSKFDFRSDEVVDGNVGKKKKEDLKKVMERLKKEKAEEGEKDEEVKKSKSWSAVLARSRGEKVYDDLELVKKSVNKAESKKRASKKKWVEREEKVKKGKEERETKRASAIANKKQEKKSKKLKKAIKKGRYIPGFS